MSVIIQHFMVKLKALPKHNYGKHVVNLTKPKPLVFYFLLQISLTRCFPIVALLLCCSSSWLTQISLYTVYIYLQLWTGMKEGPGCKKQGLPNSLFHHHFISADVGNLNHCMFCYQHLFLARPNRTRRNPTIAHSV